MPKKEQDKKKQIKPKKEKKSKKPAKPKTLAKPAPARTHQPCCTDVLKTGQAYAIPFGFSDLKGTTRLPATVGTAPVPPAPAPPAKEETHVSTQTKIGIVKKPVFTQQRKVSIAVMPTIKKTVSTGTQVQRSVYKPIATQTEPPATAETGTQVQRSVYKVVKPPARPFATQTEPSATVETGTQVQRSVYKPTKIPAEPIATQTEAPSFYASQVITPEDEPAPIWFSPAESAPSLSKKFVPSQKFLLEQEYFELTGNMAGPEMTVAKLKAKIAEIKGMTKA